MLGAATGRLMVWLGMVRVDVHLEMIPGFGVQGSFSVEIPRLKCPAGDL